MDFRGHGNDTRHAARKPPPNYFSRSVQWRLMVLVGSLMLVLTLMAEARKPQNWRWLWLAAGASPDGSDQGLGEELDTRVAGTEGNQRSELGTVRGVAAPDSLRFASGVPAAGALADLQTRAWSYVFGEVAHAAKDQLARVLLLARHNRQGAVDPDAWQPAWEELNAAWQSYLRQAERALSRDATREAGWSAALTELAEHWNGVSAPALQAPLVPRLWTQADLDALAHIQQGVDRASLELIEDDTLSRPQEQYAWFRFFERLFQLSAAELEHQSQGRVSFLQLFRQPDQYRGRLVTIEGVARLVYEVPAPENWYGIERYFVFWIKPAGGQRAPFLVYCLELTEGFPPPTDKASDPQTSELAEPVRVTGVFFKRQAYRARDGVNTTPLLLAKQPGWSTPAVPEAAARGWWPAGFSIAALLALAVLLAGLAKRVAARAPVRSVSQRPDLAGLRELDRDATGKVPDDNRT